MRNAMKHRFMPIIFPLMAFLLCDALCVFLALTTSGNTDSPKRDAALPSRPLTAQEDQTKWLVATPPALPQHCQGIPLPSAPTAALPITPDLIHTTAHGAAKTLGTTAVFFNDHVVSVAGGAIAQHVIAIALAGIVLEVVAPPG